MTNTHNTTQCRYLKDREREANNRQQVGFSSDAYFSAHAVYMADMQGQAAHAGTDSHIDILTDIGTPMPFNAMPDSEALNDESAFDSDGHINHCIMP